MNGTATLKDGKWVVEAPPHIMLRLKRVFGNISRRSHGKIRFTDTVNNCRDLAWFAERYPLEVTPAEYLQERAEEHRNRAALVASVLGGHYTSARRFELAYPPREYQRIAAELALAAHGLLLADDVGLGKTVTAIAMLTDPRTRPALVVAPTHLQRQWRAEIARFAPSLTTHVIKQGTPYDYTNGRGKRHQLSLVQLHPDVLITTYHKLSNWADTLAGVVKSVIFDEVHELRGGLKRQKKAIAKNVAAQHIAHAADFRLGLTATPIFNYGGEVWNVIQALRPDELGEYREFCEEWCDGSGDKPRLTEPEAFGSFVREAGLMLRRTREEVGRELPELVKAPQVVDADEGALDAIEGPAAELARIILGDSKVERGEAFNAGGKLEGLVRQATGIAKAPYVAEFVRMLVEAGERVVLFGWHRAVYDLWLERLRDYAPALYSGSESEKQKDDAKARFCTGKTPILIISLRSGAGLDGLQFSGCRTVVFGELDWSPAVHEQCTGRVHRDGMKESVVAYYLIAEVGSDPIVADVLGVKREQLEGIRDPEGPSGIERLDTGGANVKRIAAQYLNKRRSQEAAE